MTWKVIVSGHIPEEQEHLKNIGCTDIPKGIRKLRKQTNKINRKYCRDKLEREGLWMRLTKDKKKYAFSQRNGIIDRYFER